ncbi:RING-like domain-containing protein [Botrytis cinerea]
MENAPEQYDDTNRAFLQALLARGTLNLEEGKDLLAHIFTVQDDGRVTSADDVTKDDLNSYISKAAEALSPFDYEIRSMRHQRTNEQIWALVNSTSDPLTQIATTFTTEEMFYIKRLLDSMFESYNTKGKEVMAITSTQAIHSSVIGGSGRQSIGEADMQTIDNGVRKSEAEKVLEGLVAQGWFERSDRGYYSLSPRAILELRSWLVDTYNDSDDPDEWQRIKNCEACKGIITVGMRCSRRDCNVRLHKICQPAYFRSRPNQNCPKCETEWDGEHYVGERAATSTEDNLREKRRSGASSQRRRAPVDEGEEGEEGEEEGEE